MRSTCIDDPTSTKKNNTLIKNVILVALLISHLSDYSLIYLVTTVHVKKAKELGCKQWKCNACSVTRFIFVRLLINYI